jgi:hypothetical protein
MARQHDEGGDQHAVLAEFSGERLGEAEYAVLGSGIGGRAWRADMHEGLNRANIDDAAFAGPQGLEKRIGDIKNLGKIVRDDLFPVVDHGKRCAQHAIAPRDAGIVDQDRNLPKLVGDFLEGLAELFLIVFHHGFAAACSRSSSAVIQCIFPSFMITNSVPV